MSRSEDNGRADVLVSRHYLVVVVRTAVSGFIASSGKDADVSSIENPRKLASVSSLLTWCTSAETPHTIPETRSRPVADATQRIYVLLRRAANSMSPYYAGDRGLLR